MKERAKMRGFFLALVMGCLFVTGTVQAKMDWTTLQQIDLASGAKDVVLSADGSTLLILTSKEIVVYSPSKNMVEDRIPLDESFDRMIYNERSETLILSGGSSKTVKILRIEKILDIKVAGLPFLGPEKAPVTIAVFSDYQ